MGVCRCLDFPRVRVLRRQQWPRANTRVTGNLQGWQGRRTHQLHFGKDGDQVPTGHGDVAGAGSTLELCLGFLLLDLCLELCKLLEDEKRCYPGWDRDRGPERPCLQWSDSFLPRLCQATCCDCGSVFTLGPAVGQVSWKGGCPEGFWAGRPSVGVYTPLPQGRTCAEGPARPLPPSDICTGPDSTLCPHPCCPPRSDPHHWLAAWPPLHPYLLCNLRCHREHPARGACRALVARPHHAAGPQGPVSR